ncbi:MAG TPA: NADP-dependent oxidoreductase [Anseongella sp.]|nr:NADP-dependent oxidoreductase [Anseongella sp.]
MKAAIINRFGKAGELQVAEVDKPVAGDKEVVIKVMAAGVNPVDAKIRAGTHVSSKHLRLPVILGKDVSGVIASVGKSVTAFQPGDAVFGCIDRTYAEYTLADPGSLVKKPATVSFEEAAAVSLAGLTAYQAINEQLKVRGGQRVLIQAAAGGVGHLAVQFAKLNGAMVSGTVSGKNAGFLRELGLDQAIDYKREKFEEAASDLDAVLDAMGGEVLYRSISCVKPGGAVVCLPSSAKDDPRAVALALERGVRLTWFMMQPEQESLQLIAGLLEQGKLKVEVAKVFPLEAIAQAHELVESHGSRGKIVIRI